MSYKLNKTNGDLLIELVDGKIDTSSTNLTLVGKNYQGFGEFLNENFIKLLETFSNTAPPSKPLRGQLWYDTSEARLKVYDGATFRSTDSTIYASTQPTNLNEGDIWINGSTDQLYFFNGDNLVLVGPNYTKNQLPSGQVVETVRDTTGQNKVIVRFRINGETIGIFAKEAFTPFPTISGFTTLNKGFNLSSAHSNFKYYGTALYAENLLDSVSNTPFNPDLRYLRKDTDSTMTGKLTVQNSGGIQVIGASSGTVQLTTDGTNTVLRSSDDVYFKLTDSGGEYDGIVIDAVKNTLINPVTGGTKSGMAIGFGKNHIPQYNFDFDGDLRVTGSLIVDGDVTSLDVTRLRVEDHQIELAITDDSTLPTDSQVDQAGFIVRVTGDDKYMLWQQDTNKWDIQPTINLVDEFGGYSIDDVEVINKTSLGSTIVNSSLTSLGTLNELQVDNIGINGDRISIAGTLEIEAVATIDLINPVQIVNVANPGADNHAANKGYVDVQVEKVQEVFGLDVTGLGSTYNDDAGGGDAVLEGNVAVILEELYPAATKPDLSYAKIHASAITAASSSPIDINSNVSKTLTAVDSAGVQNVNVIGDFTISSPTATINLTTTRIVMVYQVQSDTWTHVSSTASAV